MDYQIQVVTVPVTDADQAAAFYQQEIGYRGLASPRGLPG